QENVDVIRRIYAVWGKEGSPVPSGLLDQQIEWVNPPDAIERGTRAGIDAFATALGAVSDTFAGVGVDIDEILDAGDRVVVLATLHGRGRGSGAEVERRQGYVWTLRDGKAIRFEWFNRPDDAMRAAGIHC
ncbi:MAG: nuclear transport factor 2 family protein, partial [Actinobacteria bacterium]